MFMRLLNKCQFLPPNVNYVRAGSRKVYASFHTKYMAHGRCLLQELVHALNYSFIQQFFTEAQDV